MPPDARPPATRRVQGGAHGRPQTAANGGRLAQARTRTRISAIAASLATILCFAIVAAPARADSINLTVAAATGTGQPLNYFAAFNGIRETSSPQQPTTIADGTSQPVSTQISAVPDIGLTQYWIYRLGSSGNFFIIEAQFGGGNDGDLACGWSDMNAGWDGENWSSWTSEEGCSVQQSATGSDSIAGTVTANAPPGPVSYESCWDSDAPWRSFDTGFQPLINNASWQQLNLVQAQLAQSEGSNGGLFPPVNYPDSLLAPAGRAAALQPQSGSLMLDSWQYPPDQVIGVNDTTSTFCAYDGSSSLEGSNNGTILTVTYEIGDTNQFMVLQANIPIFGSNQFSCDITDADGNVDNTNFDAACGINSNGGIGTWHATAWVTVFDT